jgi:hypothetical protein
VVDPLNVEVEVDVEVDVEVETKTYMQYMHVQCVMAIGTYVIMYTILLQAQCRTMARLNFLVKCTAMLYISHMYAVIYTYGQEASPKSRKTRFSGEHSPLKITEIDSKEHSNDVEDIKSSTRQQTR